MIDKEQFDQSLDPEQLAEDEKWMRLALDQAENAASEGEVPVGAVLVRDGEVLAKASNRPIASCDPTAHAEVRVLREAAQCERNYRLPGTTLYVTIEPCTMCVGAMVHARVSRIVFGAREPKAGAVVSQNQLLSHAAVNTEISFSEGVLEHDCRKIISEFFAFRRKQKKQLRQSSRSTAS